MKSVKHVKSVKHHIEYTDISQWNLWVDLNIRMRQLTELQRIRPICKWCFNTAMFGIKGDWYPTKPGGMLRINVLA